MFDLKPTVFFVALGLAACDMQTAETLDAPRILALQSAPAAYTSDGPSVLTALVFDVPEPLTWSLCVAAWAPTDPISCPTGAVELGTGNPLTTTLPAGLTRAWLRAAPQGGPALSAVKLVAADSDAKNPVAVGLTTPTGPLPAALTEPMVELGVDFGDLPAADAERLVVSWYTTAGTLDPGRTLGTEFATLDVPTSGPLRVIAVIREVAGGITWVDAALTIAGPAQ